MVCRLVAPTPGEVGALDLAHAVQHLPPPLVPQTIPEPPDRVWHRHPSPRWKHM
jgi:hypothetical protein